MKEEREKQATETERNMDDLQLKLANLDLKYKQLTLEDNKESYSAKRRITSLEEELARAVKERDDLVSSRQTDEAKTQRLLNEAKQKADLRIASIKKQFENEKAMSSADLSGRCHELETKVREQNMVVEDLKAECEAYTARIGALEVEMAEGHVAEVAKGKEAVELKVKHYEEFISDLEVKQARSRDLDKAQIESLKAELERVQEEREQMPGNQQKRAFQELEKQLEELKFTCDELRDEKQQLLLLSKELEEKDSRKSRVIFFL